MSKFKEFPEMPAIDPIKKNTWRLRLDYVGPLIKGKRTTAKAGFLTDLASIPRIAVLLVGGKAQIPLLAAAVLHDSECAAELYGQCETHWRFLIAMKMLGIGWFKRNSIYTGVIALGWIVFARHTLESVTHARELISFVTSFGTD